MDFSVKAKTCEAVVGESFVTVHSSWLSANMCVLKHAGECTHTAVRYVIYEQRPHILRPLSCQSPTSAFISPCLNSGYRSRIFKVLLGLVKIFWGELQDDHVNFETAEYEH